MSYNYLPRDVFSYIIALLKNPQDLVYSMRTCKSWHSAIHPLYLSISFRIIFIKHKELPMCLERKISKKRKRKHPDNSYTANDSKSNETKPVVYYLFTNP